MVYLLLLFFFFFIGYMYILILYQARCIAHNFFIDINIPIHHKKYTELPPTITFRIHLTLTLQLPFFAIPNQSFHLLTTCSFYPLKILLSSNSHSVTISCANLQFGIFDLCNPLTKSSHYPPCWISKYS